jgi:hypothetical protein
MKTDAAVLLFVALTTSVLSLPFQRTDTPVANARMEVRHAQRQK